MALTRRTITVSIVLIIVIQCLYYVLINLTRSLTKHSWLYTVGNDSYYFNQIRVLTDGKSVNLSRTNNTIHWPTIVFKNANEPIVSTTVRNARIKASVNVDSEDRPIFNASLLPTLQFTIPDTSTYSKLPRCQRLSTNTTTNDSLLYHVNVSTVLHSYSEMENNVGFSIQSGGHWFPSVCQTKQRLAVIVCYRKRESHLKLFLNHMHCFLKQQQLDYTIIVVNQHGKEPFNRGALFNIGFLEAMKLYPFTCLIFHDVDLLPEDSRNIYNCGSHPRHMSVAVDKFNYKLLYPTLFGGVTAFFVDDFILANGYPNVYWGWGNEDDDMYFRVTKRLKKSITRYPIEITRYKMIRSHGHISGVNNPHRDAILYSKYDYGLDGLNTIRYNLHQLMLYKLFTLVNVTLFEETYEQIRTRLNIKRNSKK